ncbi:MULTISPECIES: RelA/SpoT domain-containing protein [Campylobacter]|uniref:RelA/SpoT domain-containing protein n=1 Tax=Campylobacter vicugnae TaxID=1660076 RepID=A0ABZ2E7C9_9BACT|nr:MULTISPECIES: RelA/SpoT domain-containing protein [unclassified Campylobacter]MCR8690590.1 RelA/SpoT domain-containing protein [Campylobacter sp. RM9264]MCR8701501.1 RelA/SpoT domain-containing protein [Campylobacter sp. RM12176]
MRVSNTAVRKAGLSLKNNNTTKEDLDAISTFRSNHIQLMKMLVKTISKKLPKPLFIARRLKRLSSIQSKLQRFEGMCLDRMQDIGGVRAVFKNNNEVEQFVKSIKDVYLGKRSVLEIVKENDYITRPKADGYRSYHIVFKYNGKIDEVNGYHIELQLRDLLQHYWATAVEILALRSSTNIKAGYGDEHFKRFFWLCAELFAGAKEHKYEIRELDKKHNILFLLKGLNVVADKLEKAGNEESLYLMVLDAKDGILKLTAFSKGEQLLAQAMYQSMETNDSMQSVLVSIDSIKKLKKAYPNYFLDAKNFIKEVTERLK